MYLEGIETQVPRDSFTIIQQTYNVYAGTRELSSTPPTGPLCHLYLILYDEFEIRELESLEVLAAP